jgi:3-methyladenine DNA glycosylase AlkD
MLTVSLFANVQMKFMKSYEEIERKIGNFLCSQFIERIEIQIRSLYYNNNKFHFDKYEITLNSQTNIILTALYSKANPKNVEGMARFGIKSTGKVLGISTPFLRSLKKSIGKNHDLAIDLWQTEILEARILAAFIADPKLMKKTVINRWVRDFDNWAICDGVCLHCFRNTPFAHEMIRPWTKRKEEFVRRAGFTMIATLAVADTKSEDEVFLKYFPIIKKYATDDRNYVKKAINWALRQIGKRNLKLNVSAIKMAKEIQKLNSSSAKWIAADALRELKSLAVQKHLLIFSQRLKKSARRKANPSV